MNAQVLELIAVEHADGGLGEETPSAEDEDNDGHCGLCDLTSDTTAWDAVGDELGVVVRLHRSDDLAPEEQQIVREVGTPCLLARFDDADLHPVVLSERLEVFDGDVSRLLREVRLVADQQEWRLPCSAERDEPAPEHI